jgi:hypothetical protein
MKKIPAGFGARRGSAAFDEPACAIKYMLGQGNSRKKAQKFNR